MKKKSRLFALAEHLRGRRTGVTAEQLAARFGVTVRTIYRDLDDLREANVPLSAERGPGGGYALERAYSLPPINLSPREAALLVVLGRFATETRFVPFTETLGSALDKVRGALNAAAQRELLAHAEALSFAGVPQHQVKRAVGRAIEDAWFDKSAVFVRYRRSTGEVSERTVRIRAVLMERTMTMLACDDVEGGENRSIRLDRIEAARIVDLPA